MISYVSENCSTPQVIKYWVLWCGAYGLTLSCEFKSHLLTPSVHLGSSSTVEAGKESCKMIRAVGVTLNPNKKNLSL